MNTPKHPHIHYKNPHDAAREKKYRPPNRRLGFWLGLLIIVLVLFVAYSEYKKFHKTKHTTPPQPVVLGKATIANVPVYLNGLGSVTPTNTVTVKTQVNGQLQAVYFQEGQNVILGQLLAQIDPRPFEAQLIQYQGQYERDQALLANAQTDLKRYQTLWKQNSVAQQVLDTQAALVLQDEGNVKSDEGLLAGIKLNLFYCRITSPVNGRIGLRLVDPGNYVQTSDTTGLFVIATQNPVTVVFTLPEDSIPQVMTAMNAKKTLPADVYDRTQTDLLDTGSLYAVDSTIDPTTGTVKLKALFQNTQNRLFPDQFVNVKLLVTTLENAIIVPTAAIQNGADGTYIYTVNSDNKTVHTQPVTAGVTVAENTVISKGIKADQSIVLEGADKLTEGANVIAESPDSVTSTSTPAISAGLSAP
jgi:multidrug efflux system membrane fusion protein